MARTKLVPSGTRLTARFTVALGSAANMVSRRCAKLLSQYCTAACSVQRPSGICMQHCHVSIFPEASVTLGGRDKRCAEGDGAIRAEYAAGRAWLGEIHHGLFPNPIQKLALACRAFTDCTLPLHPLLQLHHCTYKPPIPCPPTERRSRMPSSCVRRSRPRSRPMGSGSRECCSGGRADPRFGGSHVVKTILAGGGFDWVLIDAEHGQITDANYYDVSLSPRGCRVRPAALWGGGRIRRRLGRQHDLAWP